MIKSRKESVVFSRVFSGCKNSTVEGTWPEKTAVACLSILFSSSVIPIQDASWSTDGLVLTVTSTLLACLMRSTICCLSGLWSIFLFEDFTFITSMAQISILQTQAQ